jgi:teichuronic acid biosynthesis glycosyltransferase TuaG
LSDLQPLVSIITPLYKASKWLDDLFETVDSQTIQNCELIMVDDASPIDDYSVVLDRVSRRANTYLYRLSENAGPGRARNLGLEKAKGRFIAFLDADDLWMPNKLQTQTDFMMENQVPFSFHDYRHMSPDGKLVGELICGPDKLDFKTHHVRRGTGGCLSVMLDTHSFKDFRFPDVARHLPEDYLAWLEIIKSGHVGVRLPQDLGRYRVSASSRSGNKLAQARSIWRIYRNVERLPLLTCASWWFQYSINSVLMYRGAKPYMPIENTNTTQT